MHYLHNSSNNSETLDRVGVPLQPVPIIKGELTMSEYFSAYHFSEEEQDELATISRSTLEIVDHTYGSGYPEWQQGTNELAYHNGHHARAVGEGAVRLCVNLDLSAAEQSIARISGHAHDFVQLQGSGINEAKSVAWLDTRLQEATFPPKFRNMARLAILGTEPLFEDGKIVNQKANLQEYPDKATELVAKSVASADLGELYTPEGPYMGHQLFREIKGAPDRIPMDDLIEFQRRQLELLEAYRYPLQEANTVLATHKSEVINYSHEVLDELEKGEIESWDKLIARDQRFIERHR